MDNVPVTNQVPTEAAAPIERMLTQSTVNELIGNAKREAAEKAATRAVDDYKRKLAEDQQYATQSNTAHLPRGLSEEDVKRLAGAELTQKMSEMERQFEEKKQLEMAERIVNTYRDKIAVGQEKYQDFEAVTSRVNMADFSNVVHLIADHVDNGADVLYHLAQHPGKLDELDRLCERKSQYAVSEMKRLSDSIKANEQAAQVRTSKAPLSQQRHSNTGTESGSLSIADYKKLYRG